MANNPYMLPTLAGNGYGVPAPVKPPTPNPVRGGGSDPRYLPPAGSGLPPQPWGVNNHVVGNPLGGGAGIGGYGLGNQFGSQNPVGLGSAGGRWYTPTPPQGTAGGYAYTPRQFEADKQGVDYRGTFMPSDAEGQKIWTAMPIQTKQELDQVHAAGGGAFVDALLKAQQAGPSGVIFNGQFMSGDQMFEIVKTKMRAYMDAIAQARQQGKQLPQTPNRVTVGY